MCLPFYPSSTSSSCLLTCESLALQTRPGSISGEDAARFYAAEVCSWSCLHLMGFIYRDLKPNILLLNAVYHARFHRLSKQSGPGVPRHSRAVVATPPQVCLLLIPSHVLLISERILLWGRKVYRTRGDQGCGHTSAVDWWTLGILIYEMLAQHYSIQRKEPKRRLPAFCEDIASQSTLVRSEHRICASPDRKRPIKDETKRLGARWCFRSNSPSSADQWALVAHEAAYDSWGRAGTDTVSTSVTSRRGAKRRECWRHRSTKMKGVPMDSGLATPERRTQ